jgi:hypothetical protein
MPKTAFFEKNRQKPPFLLDVCISIVKLVSLLGAWPEELRKVCKNLK